MYGTIKKNTRRGTMNNWKKPVATTYDLMDMSEEVEAKAWSTEPEEYNINDYLNYAQEGDWGYIYDDNYGLVISVQCVGIAWYFGMCVKSVLYPDGSIQKFIDEGNGWALFLL